MNKLLTTIPFQGFYHGAHDATIDAAIERDAEYFGIDPDDIVSHADFDFTAICTEYAKSYSMWFGSVAMQELGFDPMLEFESLQSPRFYNYATDRIFCHIPEDSVRRIIEHVGRDQLAETIKARFTSGSGFISHYSNRIDDWMHKPTDQWDHNEVGTVLEALVQCNESEFDEWEAATYCGETLSETLPYDPAWEKNVHE